MKRFKKFIAVLTLPLTLAGCCDFASFFGGFGSNPCNGGRAPAAIGCELQDGTRSVPSNQAACCTDQPFSAEELDKIKERTLLSACCNGTVPRVTTVDEPCGEFANETTGSFDAAKAAAICAENFGELSPDAQIDNQCCNDGTLRPEASTSGACIARFPAPPPNPMPTPSPAPSLNASAATTFCASFDASFDAQFHNSTGCTTCSQARIDPLTGLPPLGCPRSPADNTTDQLAGGASAIQIAIRQLANAEVLIGGNNLRLGAATNAATAGTSGKPPVANPVVPLLKPSTGTTTGASGGGKGGGSSGGFLGGNSGGTGVLAATEVGAIAMNESAATATGGGGGGSASFKGRGGDDDATVDGEGTGEKLEGLLFKGQREASSQMETPEDYWNRIARTLSIFDVVTRGYRRETGRWAMANVRAIQSPQNRVVNRALASPRTPRAVIKGSKRR